MASPSRATIGILIGGMLLTGASNSLWSKWQDMQCVEDCDTNKPVLYEQPVWQSLQMFIGEMLCFLPVVYAWASTRIQARRANGAVHLPEDSIVPPKEAVNALRGPALLLMWIPAICDLTGTTLMNVGLLYTPVSIYQMTRGALVLFVGAFSVVFLRRRLWLYQWLSLMIVIAGVSLVGLSGSLIKDAIREDTTVLTVLKRTLMDIDLPGADLPAPVPIEKPAATKVLLGVFFILFAQVFTATQFVVEENIMGRYEVAPLVAVGLEGFFGALSIGLLLPLAVWLVNPANAPKDSAYAHFFDMQRGWNQMINTPTVLWSGAAIMCSIAMFNFFGLSVTRYASATARSLTDTCRTLLIWVVSLGLGWERLVWPLSLLQVSGFALLVYGTFMFNNLVQPPIKSLRPPPSQASIDQLINDEEARGLLAGNEDVEGSGAAGADATATLPAAAAAASRTGYDVAPAGH